MRIRQLVSTAGQQIQLGPFTVLVGANNVGKSQTLRDVHDKIVNGAGARTVLVSQVAVDKPATLDEAFRGLSVADHPSHLNHKIVRGITSNLVSGEEVTFQTDSFERQFAEANDASFLLGNLGRFRVAFLDAASRLSVAAATPSFNPHASAPQRLLQGLFAAGQQVETDLRTAFRDTFGMEIRLDYSGMTQLVLRVANHFDVIPADPREAFPVASRYGTLDSQGDGFRSFVGVVLSLLLSEGRVVLLDEPEAFLHPAQARQLGYWVADYAQRAAGQVIVATHNSSFLAGILARGTPVDIYRLNRTGDVTRYNKIAADSINQLTRAPLLSSQAVLDAFFHRGVVVCEADGDRAVYQTVATRRWGSQNVLFLHAQSKQNVKDVVGLLRNATIPVASVVDIDILDSAVDVENLCAALGSANTANAVNMRNQVAAAVEGRTDDALLAELQTGLAELQEQLDRGEHTLSGARSALRRIDASANRWADAKRNGIEGLPEQVRGVARDLVALLRQDGFFVVQVGELESWIELGTRRKKVWVIRALEHLFQNHFPEGLSTFVAELLRFLGEEPRPVNIGEPAAAAAPAG